MPRTDADGISSLPIFDDVPRNRIGELGRLIDELEVPAAAVLTKQGEYAREFFIILEGAAAVIRDEQRVATLGPGDFFGEVGLLSTTWRVATVEALSPMRLLVIGPREFQTLMLMLPSVAEQVSLAAAERE
jgi:cAMP-dependent protein kinase regulator/CRP/FNR family cyclic AMP-dependent transcriptional regulator/cGMP-dependent protein kinase 2